MRRIRRIRRLALVAVAVATAFLFAAASLHHGIRHAQQALIDQIGANVFYVHSNGARFFTEDDREHVSRLPSVEQVTGEGSSTTVYLPEATFSLTFFGVGTAYADFFRWSFSQGGIWNDAGEHVAVLGAEVAKAVYGVENPIEQELQGYRVVGVLEEYPAEDVLRYALNTRVLTPIDEAPRPVIASRAGTYGCLWVRAKGSIDEAIRDVCAVLPGVHASRLSERYGGVFFIERLIERILSVASLAMVLLSGALVSTVSFLSTHIRTWEIGVRRAVGATRSTVARLLLRDMAHLMAQGALAGGAVGACLTVIAWGADWLLRFGPLHALALALPIAVGLLACAPTAFHASKIPVVQALRERGLRLRPVQGFPKSLVSILLAVTISATGIYVLWTMHEASMHEIADLWGDVDDSIVWVASPRKSILLAPELSLDDATRLEALEGIESVAPVEGVHASITQPRSRTIKIQGVGEGFARFGDLLSIARGRLLTNDEFAEGHPIAIISSGLARSLFGVDDPTGEILKTSVGAFTLVGTFNSQSSILREMAGLIVPDGALSRAQQIPSEYGFWIRMKGDIDTQNAGAAIRDAFRRWYPERADVEVRFPAQEIREEKARITPILTQLLLVVAIVLGLSLLNTVATIDFLLALQRREIGVRRALGATRLRTVLRSARLAGSVALVAILVGVPLGVLLGPAVASYVLLDYAFSWSGVAATLAIIMTLSVMAGGGAAMRLARSSPAQTLLGAR